jgi:hypothetical protein
MGGRTISGKTRKVPTNNQTKAENIVNPLRLATKQSLEEIVGGGSSLTNEDREEDITLVDLLFFDFTLK